MGGRVGYLVTSAGASTFEGVDKTKPVTSLVGGSLSKVEASGRSSGDGGRQDGAAVPDEGSGAGGGRGRVIAVAQVPAEALEEIARATRAGEMPAFLTKEDQ